MTHETSSWAVGEIRNTIRSVCTKLSKSSVHNCRQSHMFFMISVFMISVSMSYSWGGGQTYLSIFASDNREMGKGIDVCSHKFTFVIWFKNIYYIGLTIWYILGTIFSTFNLVTQIWGIKNFIDFWNEFWHLQKSIISPKGTSRNYYVF